MRRALLARMDCRDQITALLTQMGTRMEDLSADCICARGIDEAELDQLVERCGRTIDELDELLNRVRAARDKLKR
ncbi:MAG: hypothetical protein V4530_11135 [Pseudomonadota bacterium]